MAYTSSLQALILSFVVMVDIAPVTVQSGVGKGLSLIGLHFSGCKFGRFRSCAVGLQILNFPLNNTSEEEASILITFPQSIRLNDTFQGFNEYTDTPEVDLNIAPFYNPSYRRWGVSVGFSFGW